MAKLINFRSILIMVNSTVDTLISETKESQVQRDKYVVADFFMQSCRVCEWSFEVIELISITDSILYCNIFIYVAIVKSSEH